MLEFYFQMLLQAEPHFPRILAFMNCSYSVWCEVGFVPAAVTDLTCESCAA